MKKKIGLTSLFILLIGNSFGQRAVFNNNFSSGANYNPALTGYNGSPRALGLYNNRWPNSNWSAVTAAALYDQPLELLHGGVGVSYYGDFLPNLLDYRWQEINLHYSYQLDLNEKSDLNVGVTGGIYSRYIDVSQLTFVNPVDANGNVLVDPNLPEEREIGSQMGLGVTYSRKSFLCGLSATDINNVFSNTPSPLWNAHAAYQLSLTENIGLGMECSFFRQNGLKGSRASVQANYKSFVLGINHFFRKSLGVLIGVNHGNVRIAYSPSFTISALTNQTSFGHEIVFRWDFRQAQTQGKNLFDWKFF